MPADDGLLRVLMLRPGEEVALPRDSASAVFHVVEGRIEIAGATLPAEDADVLTAPACAPVHLLNRTTTKPAFPVQVDDAPSQRGIGIYERFDA